MEVLTQKSSYPFLKGGGEMGELTRNYDWSKNELGDPGQWPQSLRTALSIVLNSKFPMLLWWGSNLIQFYNDAYRPSLGNNGKHPTALGQKGEECWPETWPIIKPLIDQVHAGDDATWSEDQLIPIYRNGKLEDVYWTFSYSAVKGEGGNVEGVLVVCNETTNKVLSQRKAIEKEYNLRNTILQAPVAICIFKGERHVLEIANDRMYELWGKKEADLLGRPIFEGLPEASGQGFEELLNGVYTTGQTYKAYALPITLPRKGGVETVYVDFVYQAFKEADGNISGVMALAIEVTEKVKAEKRLEESEAQLQLRVKERTAELESMNKELQRSNSNLEEFAHAASHDLKEPIRKIHFFTERLKNQIRDRLTQDDINILNRIENASHRMGILVDDLLVYSHVSLQPHEMEEIDLNDKLRKVLDDLELDVAEKQAVITIANLPVVKGYRRQLQQLFQNLISNALKYSKPDTKPAIVITSTIVTGKEAGTIFPTADAEKKYFLIEVKDNGIGFEQENAEKIFQMFQRLHGRKEYSGTGVGLSIARKVVQNHNGKILAESEPGKGSVFKVYLPVL